MNIFTTTMQYLKERQTPLVRILHMTIIILIVSQIIFSNFMAFNNSGDISSNTIEFYGTWMHIITGLFLMPIAVIFLVVELRQHSLKYYFPYLFGEFMQLSIDFKQLLKLKLPSSSDYGLAASVQGLGLGALFLVLFSGLLWFITWNANLPWSHDVEEVHKLLTGLVQAYIIAHGFMGLLHIFIYSRSLKNG
jgi:cytochrome b561